MKLGFRSRVTLALLAIAAAVALGLVVHHHDLGRRGYRTLESAWYNRYVEGYRYVLADTAAGVPAYLEVLPPGDVRGLLVLVGSVPADDPDWGETVKLHGLAARAGLMTIYVEPGDRYADLLLTDTTLDALDAAVAAVRQEHDVGSRVVMGGHSLDGSLAVRFAEHCAAGRCRDGLRLAGVFAVDAPLDFERFWHMCQRAVGRRYHPDPVGECTWVLDRMEHTFGGDPDDHRNAYRRLSPFLHSEPDGGNLTLLASTAVRLYTEPDIDWYLENRGKDYYDLNAVDSAAIVNRLRALGNGQAQLIATRDRGYVWGERTRHPHSWQIIDEHELVAWIRELFDTTDRDTA